MASRRMRPAADFRHPCSLRAPQRGWPALTLALLLGACPRPPSAPTTKPGPSTKDSPRAVRRPPQGPPPYAVSVRLSPEATGALTTQLKTVMERDFARSGVLAPPPSPSPAMGVWPKASSSRTQAHTVVVLHTAARSRGPAARAVVYFPAAGGDVPVGIFNLRDQQPRRLAHRLANAVYALHTGTPGPFLSQIAFVAGTNTNPRQRQIFAVSFDGHRIRRLSAAGAQNILPAWSPTGDVVFTSFARGNPDLVLRPAAGGPVQRLSTHEGLNTGGAFSPDGQSIALTLSRHGNTDIYLIARDGTIIRRLTRHPKIDVSPTWSPDGSHIAFVSSRSGTPQLYLVAASGGRPRRLTFRGTYNQEPDWCPLPSSQLLAFTYGRGGNLFDVHIVNVETGKVRRLTRDGISQSPSWSPDCRLIAFSAGRGGLWTITADGSRRFRLLSGPAQTPAWSPRLASPNQ